MEVASVLFESVLSGPFQPRVRPRFADPRWQLLTDEEDVPNLVLLRRRQYYIDGASAPPPIPDSFPVQHAWLRLLASVLLPGALEEEEDFHSTLLRLVQKHAAFYYEPPPPPPQPEPQQARNLRQLVANQAYEDEEADYANVLLRTARRFQPVWEGMEVAQSLLEVVVSGPWQPPVRPRFGDPRWQLITDEEDVPNLVLLRRGRWVFDPNSVIPPTPLLPRKLPSLVRQQAEELEEAEQHQALLQWLTKIRGWDADPIYTPNNMEVAQSLLEAVVKGPWQPPIIPNLALRTASLTSQELGDEEQFQALLQSALVRKRFDLSGASPPPPSTGRRTVLMFIT